MSAPRDDSPPSFVGVILPSERELWVGELCVVVTAIEQWTTMVVVHAVFPLMPEADNYPGWPHQMFDDLNHLFPTTSIDFVRGAPGVARRLVITSTGTIDPRASELQVEWKRGLLLTIPLPPAVTRAGGRAG